MVWGHDVGAATSPPGSTAGAIRGSRSARTWQAARTEQRGTGRRGVDHQPGGHCETLMSPKWRSIGIAYARDGAEHLWTVDFGDR